MTEIKLFFSISISFHNTNLNYLTSLMILADIFVYTYINFYIFTSEIDPRKISHKYVNTLYMYIYK